MCTHFIGLMGIHLLCYVHGNERKDIHDVVHNTFDAILRNAGFHVGQK